MEGWAPRTLTGSAIRLLALTAALAAVGVSPQTLSAQSEGSNAAAVATAALGTFSGGVLGLSGSLVPCSQRVGGLLCTRLTAAAGAVVGGVSGAIIGGRDSDRARALARSAGTGALVGGASGAVLQAIVRQYGWPDAAAGAVLGAAIGAAPRGAGIGFAAGAVVGGILWRLEPSFEVADAAGLALAGLAIGGLASWVAAAADSGGSDGSAAVTVSLSLSMPGA